MKYDGINRYKNLMVPMMKYDGINRYKNLTVPMMNLTDITELTFSTFRGHCHTSPIIVHVVCFLCENFAFFQFLVEFYRRGKGGGQYIFRIGAKYMPDVMHIAMLTIPCTLICMHVVSFSTFNKQS